MDGSSSMETRKNKYREILLLGFITCESINYKYLMKKLFNGGYYDPGGAYIRLNVCNMTPREEYTRINHTCKKKRKSACTTG